MAGPEALVKYLGQYTAIGIPPTCDGGSVARVQCVLEDHLVRVERMPCSCEGHVTFANNYASFLYVGIVQNNMPCSFVIRLSVVALGEK